MSNHKYFKMNKPTLFIFSGLPGSGKSTIAQRLSKKLGIAYLRIDTVEQGLKDLCNINVYDEGYRLSYRIVEDNLKLGISIIADSCNPIELTRSDWNEIARKSNSAYVNIEVKCSNKFEHRKRVETRESSIAGLKIPTWEDVKNREYHLWTSDRLLIDTADKTIDESVNELLTELETYVCRKWRA